MSKVLAGHWVAVIRKNAAPFKGVLVYSETMGVVVDNNDETPDYRVRLFIPFNDIIEIQDTRRGP